LTAIGVLPGRAFSSEPRRLTATGARAAPNVGRGDVVGCLPDLQMAAMVRLSLLSLANTSKLWRRATFVDDGDGDGRLFWSLFSSVCDPVECFLDVFLYTSSTVCGSSQTASLIKFQMSLLQQSLIATYVIAIYRVPDRSERIEFTNKYTVSKIIIENRV